MDKLDAYQKAKIKVLSHATERLMSHAENLVAAEARFFNSNYTLDDAKESLREILDNLAGAAKWLAEQKTKTKRGTK